MDDLMRGRSVRGWQAMQIRRLERRAARAQRRMADGGGLASERRRPGGWGRLG